MYIYIYIYIYIYVCMYVCIYTYIYSKHCLTLVRSDQRIHQCQEEAKSGPERKREERGGGARGK